jgi:aryl-alcohol dehydrogenase-like predicted oxidoreductase
MGALAQAVHQGKALYAGISNYPADRTREAAKTPILPPENWRRSIKYGPEFSG